MKGDKNMITSLNRNNKIHCEMSGTDDALASELKTIFMNFLKNKPEIINVVMLSLASELKESIEVIDSKKTRLIYYVLKGIHEDDHD